MSHKTVKDIIPDEDLVGRTRKPIPGVPDINERIPGGYMDDGDFFAGEPFTSDMSKVPFRRKGK